MNMYVLVSLLHKVSLLVQTQVRLASEHKLQRHQRKLFKSTHSKIFKFWNQYEVGDRSALQLLRACSRLFGPKVKNLFEKSVHN